MQLKLIFAAVIVTAACSVIAAQNTWANLKITPQYPAAGEAIRFEYEGANTRIATGTADLEVLAVAYADGAPQALDVVGVPSGSRLSGSFMPAPNTDAVLLLFRRGQQWETNRGEGYFIYINSWENKVPAATLAAHAELYMVNGNSYELNRKPAVALNLLEKAIQQEEKILEKHFEMYIRTLMSVKREAGRSEAVKLLGNLEQKLTAESQLMQVASLYERLGQSEKAGALRTKLRTAHPKGLLVKRERVEQIGYTADLAARETAIQALRNDYPPQNETDWETFNYLYYNLAKKYADQDKIEKAIETGEKLEPPVRAELFNDLAWNWAEENRNLQEAKNLSKKTVEWAYTEISKPTTPRPATASRADWKKSRTELYAGYADTYALVLNKLGDLAGAVENQAMAVQFTNGEVPDLNERYTAYLEQTNAPELRYHLEGFLLKGMATAEMREQFIRLYTRQDTSRAAAEVYLKRLAVKAQANRKTSLAQKMLDQPAPAFVLKNLKGETVSLEKLRGKVVVADFWATWCGPCKMSFPGMQKAIENYSQDTAVAFVFIDCWERSANRQEIVSEFINSKAYPFNVLLDEEDKVVAEFGVSGIPTKFVIDPSGNVRFKSVGYGGDNEALVEELSAMIELAKK